MVDSDVVVDDGIIFKEEVENVYYDNFFEGKVQVNVVNVTTVDKNFDYFNFYCICKDQVVDIQGIDEVVSYVVIHENVQEEEIVDNDKMVNEIIVKSMDVMVDNVFNNEDFTFEDDNHVNTFRDYDDVDVNVCVILKI